MEGCADDDLEMKNETSTLSVLTVEDCYSFAFGARNDDKAIHSTFHSLKALIEPE